MSQTTVQGNLAADVEITFTNKTGRAKARFRIIEDQGYFDRKTREWVETRSNTFFVEAWGRLAENIAESFREGDPIIALLEAKTSEWTDTNTGEKRQRSYHLAKSVGFDVERHTVTAVKNPPRQDTNPAQH